MTKSPLLYYCRSFDGSRSLRRSLALARQFSETFEVTLLVGDVHGSGMSAGDGIKIVQLPKFDIDLGGDSSDGTATKKLHEQIVARRDLIIETYLRVKPRVVVIEGFPLSEQKLAGEILPLIERAKYSIQGESLVVCAVDGILADGQTNPDGNHDRSASLLNKYFDLVVVYTDSVFARLEEFFQPANALTIPIFHTGFVSSESEPTVAESGTHDDLLLVSAADGLYGSPLYRAAIEAQRTLWHTSGTPMTIVGGEQLPEATWLQLMTLASDVPGLTMKRSVNDLRDEISRARWSVNQCGYNTAMDIVETSVPSLFVPAQGGRSKEQLIRAQRLVYWGAGRLLMPHHLNGASLANEIHQLMKFESRSLSFDCNGAVQTAELISELASRDKYRGLIDDDYLGQPLH